MKYTTEITALLLDDFAKADKSDMPALVKTLSEKFDTSERSIIAKLSAEGVYTRKTYKNKQGEIPIKKEEYIEKIAALLDVNQEYLESLEKVNKSVLALLTKALE